MHLGYIQDESLQSQAVTRCISARPRYLAGHVGVLVVAEAVGLVQVVHGAVKGVHELVLQELGIRQVPSPSALLQAAAVACIGNACQLAHIRGPDESALAACMIT